MESNSIVVVGSCMIDFTSYCPRLPKEGETIHGSEFKTAFGGKGGNQCVASAKLGGNTTFIARVGSDSWGKQYLENLKSLKVNSDFVQITPNSTTGIAQINVASSGANQIVIIAGANNQLQEQDVIKAREKIEKADVLVCQLETLPEISILNGAPALSNCDTKLFTLPTIFCVNESEASVFANCPVKSLQDAKNAIDVLLSKGCNTVILTMGSEGSLLASKSSPTPKHIPTRSVECVDSTGAGDAFIGALAYLLANQKDCDLEKGIEFANYVAADSVTRLGTQISFPEMEILQRFTF
ncbi:hypothetical protein FQR65_LT13885 [Abscondita terminalis]|nr:hypothetical protein FQR65_LT13885 [Abscondita terminalis]